MRLAIIGTGLIGASAGLAARRVEVGEVVGWDEDPNALDVAVEREAVTRAESLPEALEGADVALVAIPVAALPAVVRSVLDVASETCTVTDVGSTKGAWVAAQPEPKPSRPEAIRALWAAIRSAAPRRAGRTARRPTSSPARRGSSRP